MPSSEGGLVRYFDDEYKSKIMVRPEYVVAAIIAAIVIVIALGYLA